MANAETIAGISSGGPDVASAPSDRLLWARYVEHGDESAFTALVHRHGRIVWSVCRRLLHQEQDVEDACQAVFLVLARKIATIRKGEAVGSWLYGVAHRTALKARSRAARRCVREQQAAAPAQQPPAPPSVAAYRELQRILDEEVERLPAKYRAPFVLCCLEGMTRPEAAAELGWKEGTVCGRLAQARKLLQSRLAKRGITLSAILTAGALSQSTAAAAPATVIGPAAVKAVLSSVASGNAATAVSPTALALADSVTRSLTGSVLKLALWLGLTLCLAAGVSLAAFSDKADPVAPRPKQAPMVKAAAPEEPPKQPGGAIRWVGDLVFSPDAKRMATSISRVDQPGRLRIWEAAVHDDLLNLTDVPLSSALAFSPDGRTLALAELEDHIRLRDASTGRETAVFKGPGKEVYSLAYSPDGAQLLAGNAGGMLTVWDLKAPATPRVIGGHRGDVLCVAFLHRQPGFVSGSQDQDARVWDADGKTKLVLSGHKGGIAALAVAPDDSLLAAVGLDKTLTLWDLQTGKQTAVLERNDGLVTAMAFSPDGNRLALAAPNGEIRLWDVKTRKVVKHLDRQVAPMRALAFSPDGKYLSAGSNNLPGVVQLDVEGDAGKTARFQEFNLSLRDKAEILQNLELWGVEAEERVRFEPEGLRILLPAGKPLESRGSGVVLNRIVRGDFEITVNYEILHEPKAADNDTNTYFNLAVILNRSPETRNMASIARRVTQRQRQFCIWHILQVGEAAAGDKKRFITIPAASGTGRLRLKRAGTILSYCVADGARGPFKLFRQIPFVAEDLKEIQLTANTGGPKTSLDVRYTDLKIRAESLPNSPTTGSPVADAVQTAADAGNRAFARGPAAVVIVLGLAGCLGASLIVFLRRRRGRQAVRTLPVSEQGAQPAAPESALSGVCTRCGKKLRAAPGLAGKKVRCPQCGEAVQVPSE